MFDIMMATCSERGARAANEDALRVGRIDAMQYAVLCDGAGGHEGGAEASRRVVEHVAAALHATGSALRPERLTQTLLSAHAELQRAQNGAQGQRRMHATVVVLWIDSGTDRAVWSHVGDSRLYRLRYGAIELMTADDSVVQRMLESGVLTPRQAQQHPMKNQLLAAVGMQDGLEPHTLAEAALIEDGDAFLLCSDGWWGLLDATDMTGTLSDADTPQAWLDAMRKLIETRGTGGHDNFSAIAVWVSDPAESTQSMPDDDATLPAPFSRSQGNVALPLSGISSGDGRRMPSAWGRSQGNVALPLSDIPTGGGRRMSSAWGCS